MRTADVKGYDMDELHQWWYNVDTGETEFGPGAPNAERMGPYATQQDAEHALDLARQRNEAWDAQDEE